MAASFNLYLFSDQNKMPAWGSYTMQVSLTTLYITMVQAMKLEATMVMEK